MADLVDVENTLQSIISAGLYPNGTGQPSVTGDTFKIGRGWPAPADLDANLKAKIVTVSIYPLPNERNVTRYPLDWETSAAASPKVTATISGNTITIGGTIQAGDFVMVKVGFVKAYSVSVGSGSTLATIAAAIVSAMIADFPGTAAVGSVVTVNSGAALAAVCGGQGTSWKELRRQVKDFQITVWCATPSQRDAVGPKVDGIFANIIRFTLPDNSFARLIYQKNIVSDKGQLEQAYRRDLFYSIRSEERR